MDFVKLDPIVNLPMANKKNEILMVENDYLYLDPSIGNFGIGGV